MKKLLLAAVLAICLILISACDIVNIPPSTSPTTPPATTETTTEPGSPSPSTANSSDPAPPIGELKVHFINVGQGDAILIDLQDIEILIDGGDRSPGITGYLNDHVDGPLEVMVATHPHADHIGGLIAILDAFEVDQI